MVLQNFTNVEKDVLNTNGEAYPTYYDANQAMTTKAEDISHTEEEDEEEEEPVPITFVEVKAEPEVSRMSVSSVRQIYIYIYIYLLNCNWALTRWQ
jgi:hypothetical protein